MAKKKRVSPQHWYERKHLAVGVKNVVSLARRGHCEDAYRVYYRLLDVGGERHIKSATWARLRKELKRCHRKAHPRRG